VDSEGKIVLVGEQGEMCIRGYLNMIGYWEDPAKTAETVDSARWLHTG
jgi:fatty-acyl-CoA synthase